MPKYLHLLLILSFLIFSCRQKNENTLFREVPISHSGIDFTNSLREYQNWNYLLYYYFYNGGGVGIGDINNDGLPDIFFTGNQQKNKLYLNKGGLTFEDISLKAGVEGGENWATGVTMADVNGDGFLDIYVCYSGKFSDRTNKLFINNGDLTFTESAEEWGIADQGYSTQAVFFDMDNDGDLDMYLLNHPIDFNKIVNLQMNRGTAEFGSDKLFRNDNGKFTDVTEEAGINRYGYGLGVVAGDFNQNGYTDIFVANDFLTPDYLFMNQGDGTFTDEIQTAMGHSSYFGMGVDAADLNNDGLLDIMELDMMPEDHYRRLTNTKELSRNMFWRSVGLGNHYQYMINTLQLNRGNDTNQTPIFSEIAQFTGMDQTDWSWAVLMADFDNDGWKDVFITNGIRRDVNDNDYWKNSRNTNTELIIDRADIEKIPVTPLENKIFRNKGGNKFEPPSLEWGLNFKGFSSGAAYADLDGDGDLDLVVNNLDAPASIFENRTSQKDSSHFLRVALRDTGGNTFGLGAKVQIWQGEATQFAELTTTRGFQSSVEPVVHFGLGNNASVDSLHVTWPGGPTEAFPAPLTDTLLLFHIGQGRPVPDKLPEPKLLRAVDPLVLGVPFIHREDAYNDFDHEPLLPYALSKLGPALAVGDVNGDGMDDFYIGGAAGQASQLFTQRKDGTFSPSQQALWESDGMYEDTGALFFDATGNGAPDLYVVSGGNHLPEGDDLLANRLYLNDGKGNFTKAVSREGVVPISGKAVASGDFDGDGSKDLFIGGRLVPGRYGATPRSFLLRNDGQGGFEDVTPEPLKHPGMVTAALWADLDGDGREDLILAGEWMPIRVFLNNVEGFTEATAEYGLENTAGWWESLTPLQSENGELRLIAGNAGENIRFRKGRGLPLTLLAGDLDGKGNHGLAIGYQEGAATYPARDKNALGEQFPSVKNRFTDYASYAAATLEEVFPEGQRGEHRVLHAQEMRSLAITFGNQGTTLTPLPPESQFSVLKDIAGVDITGDGVMEYITVGNRLLTEVNTPRVDACVGGVLKVTAEGEFQQVPLTSSGFLASGDTRKVAVLNTARKPLILVARNDDSLLFFTFP